MSSNALWEPNYLLFMILTYYFWNEFNINSIAQYRGIGIIPSIPHQRGWRVKNMSMTWKGSTTLTSLLVFLLMWHQTMILWGPNHTSLLVFLLMWHEKGPPHSHPCWFFFQCGIKQWFFENHTLHPLSIFGNQTIWDSLGTKLFVVHDRNLLFL